MRDLLNLDDINGGRIGDAAGRGERRRRARIPRAAAPRLDEHNRLTADETMTVAGERKNGGNDDEIEPAAVEGRAQLAQIGLAQDQGTPAAAGRGDDGAVGASDGIRADEREDADAHGSRLAGVPTASLGGDGVNESSAASTPSRIAAPKAVGRAPRVLRSKSRPPRTSSNRRTALNNASWVTSTPGRPH